MSEYKTNKIILPYLIGCLIFIFGILVYNNTDLFVLGFLLLLSYLTISIISIFSFNRIIRIKLNYFEIVKTLIYVTPLILSLLYFKNIITLIISILYFSLVIYYLINKNYVNHDNN